MNNLCFRTVVLAIKSAEVQHCRRKTKKAQQCRKASKIGTVEQLFWPYCTLNSAETQYRLRKKRLLNSAGNHQKLALLGTVEQHSFRRGYTNLQQCRSTTLPPKKKTTINCANHHQKLALMNNLCFDSVVPTTTSAKYNLDAGK